MSQESGEMSDQDITRLIQQITDPVTAKTLIRGLTAKFNFDLQWGTDAVMEEDEEGLDATFSTVKYRDIARYVGLQHDRRLTDVGSFCIRRSRLPNALLRQIYDDILDLSLQYGTVKAYISEMAVSGFVSPIINRLIPLFGGCIANKPQTPLKGRITRGGKVEYHFQAFGALAVGFIEMKREIRTDDARLDAIAQVIAECDGFDFSNSQRIPIYGILCDGILFQIFSYSSSETSNTTRPEFKMGIPLGGVFDIDAGFSLQPISDLIPFIASLRPICEVLFNFLLVAYRAGLRVSRDRLSEEGESWDQALKFAEDALNRSQEAEEMQRADSVDEAEFTAGIALVALDMSVATANELTPLAKEHGTAAPVHDWSPDEFANLLGTH